MDSLKSIAPRVTVCCATYQHVKFVRQTLEGFVTQETSFPIEVIVHDDASTDGTQEIIAEYANAHPNLFRPILQTENQFSQGREIFTRMYREAAGKYIALCEGDDYWTAPHKLQTQVALLEANPQASGCFHRADDLVESDGTLTPGFWTAPEEKDSFDIDDLFRHGSIGPTASLLLRSDIMQTVPDWVKDVPHGDFGHLAVALSKGPMLFIDESMSVYRRHSGGFHSTTYGSIATLRALQSLLVVSHTLGHQNLESYYEGLRWRLGQLEKACEANQHKLHALQEELDTTRANYDRARKSRLFRFGTACKNFTRKIGLR